MEGGITVPRGPTVYQDAARKRFLEWLVQLMGERIRKRRAAGDNSIVEARLEGEDVVLTVRPLSGQPTQELQFTFENLEQLQALLC